MSWAGGNTEPFRRSSRQGEEGTRDRVLDDGNWHAIRKGRGNRGNKGGNFILRFRERDRAGEGGGEEGEDADASCRVAHVDRGSVVWKGK